MSTSTRLLKRPYCFIMVLVLACISSYGYAQSNSQVSGTIRDASGDPIIGVTVVVDKSTKATVTDLNGVFSIEATPNSVLNISHISYKPIKIIVKKGESIRNITMESASIELDELVVVGYGVQKKVTLTGAVSSVKNEEIVATKNENIQNMLTGKVAGLRVVQSSSEPGSFKSSIDIRGLGNPLVVIDGIPRDNMNRLDPNDIETISILKDASASIYGVRAANGVILITTKKGKKGESAQVSYSGYYTWQIPSDFPNVVSADEYMTLRNEKATRYGGRLYGPQTVFTDAQINEYRSGAKESVNWKNLAFKSHAPQYQHAINISGGSDKVDYFASFGYHNQGSFLQINAINYDKYTLRSNISADLSKRLKWDIKVSGIMDKTKEPGYNSWYIIRQTWLTSAINPVYQDDAKTKLRYGPFGPNLLGMMDSDISGYYQGENKWLQSSSSLAYDIPGIKGLKARGMYSYDYYLGENKRFDKTWSSFKDSGEEMLEKSPSKVEKGYTRRDMSLWQAELNYNNTFGDHTVSGMVLFEHQKSNGDNLTGMRELSIPIDQIFAGNDDDKQKVTQGSEDWRLYYRSNQALVGRAMYDYKSKYIAEFAFRYEGSSKFPANSRWALFPSASVGWRVSEEQFWKNSPFNFISNLKLRGSFGRMGDDGALAYQFLTGYVYPADGITGGSVFDGQYVNASKSKGTPNTKISWSVSETYNAGIDLEAWNGLLGLTAEYFERERTGLLAHKLADLPGIVAATMPQENLNGDRARGFELELSHRNKIGEFSYSVRGNLAFTRTKNTYIERSRERNSYNNWRNNTNNRYNDIWWGYSDAGRFESWDDIYDYGVVIDGETLPGNYKYEDWNGDGIFDGSDAHPIANSGDRPLLNYGVTISGQWKSFDFSVLLQGSGRRYISYVELLYEPLWADVNALSQFMDRWHPEDPKANPYDPATKWVKGNYAYTGYQPNQNSTFNMQNAAYLRLKSVELGYTLPRKWTNFIGIENLRFYVSGYNLLTFTKLKYLDPEFPSTAYGYNYPLNKTVTVGLNVKF